MYREMLADTEAYFNFGRATYPPTAFNTAAYRVTERDRGTAAHSASSPDTTADAYRLAAPNSGAAPLGVFSLIPSDW